MRLVYTDTGKEVQLGDILFDTDGEQVTIEFFRKPHKPSSSGKMSIKGDDGHTYERYVNHYGLEWIEREDQGWRDPVLVLATIKAIMCTIHENDSFTNMDEDELYEAVKVTTIGETLSLSDLTFGELYIWYKGAGK